MFLIDVDYSCNLARGYGLTEEYLVLLMRFAWHFLSSMIPHARLIKHADVRVVDAFATLTPRVIPNSAPFAISDDS